MRVGKVEIPPVWEKDHKVIARKAKQLFNETHEQIGKPVLTIDNTLDICEVVLQKLRLWRKSPEYNKEVDKMLDIKV